MADITDDRPVIMVEFNEHNNVLTIHSTRENTFNPKNPLDDLCQAEKYLAIDGVDNAKYTRYSIAITIGKAFDEIPVIEKVFHTYHRANYVDNPDFVNIKNQTRAELKLDK